MNLTNKFLSITCYDASSQLFRKYSKMFLLKCLMVNCGINTKTNTTLVNECNGITQKVVQALGYLVLPICITAAAAQGHTNVLARKKLK